MICVDFYRREEKFVGFKAGGHSGYSQIGTDIVCASVSSAAQLCVVFATEVVKAKCTFEQIDKNAYLYLMEQGNSFQLDDMIKAFYLFLNELEKEYSAYIKHRIMEVQ